MGRGVNARRVRGDGVGETIAARKGTMPSQGAFRRRYEAHAVGPEAVPAQDCLIKGPRKVPEFADDYGVEGWGFVCGVLHHSLKVVSRAGSIVVPGCDLEAVDIAVAFAFAGLEFSGILAFGITGGFFDVDGGVVHVVVSR